MKDYKSIENLLDNLSNKGVLIKDKEYAINIINRYSYYSIINTYKDIFKNKHNNYKLNTTFEEIFSLYQFDKNLRVILLKYILEIELNIKSMLAETLSKKYGLKDYLNINNFDSKMDINKIKSNIEKINSEIEKQKNKHAAVKHYINKYNFIPPYVLVKILTLGEISKLYSMLVQPDRQNISKQYKISDTSLRQTLKLLTMIRNACAHNERIYNFQTKIKIDNYFKEENQTNIIYLVNVLNIIEYMLPEEYKFQFKTDISFEFALLKGNLKDMDYNKLLYLMKLSRKWLTNN